VEHLKGASLGWVPALKSFKTLATGVDVINLFSLVTDEEAKKLEC
jgi:hypothetical protein